MCVIYILHCHARLLLNGLLYFVLLYLIYVVLIWRYTSYLSGGDYYTQSYDSEIHGHAGTVGVYRSDVGGNAGYKFMYALTHTVKKTMLIRVGKMELYMTNYDGSNLYTNDKSLFDLSKMYMGLNRVIHRYKSAYVSQGRVGTGLCSVCIDFSSTGIEAVHKR